MQARGERASGRPGARIAAFYLFVLEPILDQFSVTFTVLCFIP